MIWDSEKNVYKIGVTRSNNSKRIKQLQTGNSSELSLIYLYETKYPFRLETMLHNKYSNSRVMGEWFQLDDINDFKDSCKNLDDCIKVLEINPFFCKNLR